MMSYVVRKTFFLPSFGVPDHNTVYRRGEYTATSAHPKPSAMLYYNQLTSAKAPKGYSGYLGITM